MVPVLAGPAPYR